jgi:hypothetical protein
VPLGGADGEGRIPIRVYPDGGNDVRGKIDWAVEEARGCDGGLCSGADAHGEACGEMMGRHSWPCIGVVRQRRKNLESPHLLRDCVRNPEKADGLRTLEGVPREDCILDTG